MKRYVSETGTGTKFYQELFHNKRKEVTQVMQKKFGNFILITDNAASRVKPFHFKT